MVLTFFSVFVKFPMGQLASISRGQFMSKLDPKNGV